LEDSDSVATKATNPVATSWEPNRANCGRRRAYSPTATGTATRDPRASPSSHAYSDPLPVVVIAMAAAVNPAAAMARTSSAARLSEITNRR
jgi:hypothetical protein